MCFSQIRICPIATAVLAVAAHIFIPDAVGQTTVTAVPVGYMMLDVTGTGGASASTLSFKGLGLTRPVEYQGSAEIVGINTLVDSQATWTDNQFNGENGAYFVEITSGPGTGTAYDIAGTATGTKTITLEQNLAQGVANGVAFKIRKHWTIGSVFGFGNEAGLGSGSFTTADQILVWNGSDYDRYYYRTNGPGGTGWRRGVDENTDAAGAKIYPEDGLIISRRQASDVNVMLMGEVKKGQTSVPISVGTNVIGNVYAAPMTLQSSGIYTGNVATGLAGGDATTADQLLIWNGTGYDIYYYQTQGLGGTGWRNMKAPAVDAGSAQLPVGTAVIIKRKANIAFDWAIPQHPVAF